VSCRAGRNEDEVESDESILLVNAFSMRDSVCKGFVLVFNWLVTRFTSVDIKLLVKIGCEENNILKASSKSISFSISILFSQRQYIHRNIQLNVFM
jgi:hypothetical protein